MRKDVVILAAALVVVAGVALWFGTREDLRALPTEATPVAAAVAPPPSALPAHREPAAVIAPSVASRPRAPFNRYLSGDDLWTTFQTLRRGTTGGELWVAETIMRGCFFITRPRAIVQQILAGEDLMVVDPMTKEETDLYLSGQGNLRSHREKATDDQVAAAREIATRCAAFGSMTGFEYRTLVNDLSARRQRTDDPVAIAESIGAHRLQATDDRLRSVLASRDPVAIQFIDDELAGRLALRVQRTLTEDEATANSLALRLVQCDLGNDCDPNSETALVDCMHRAALCRLDVPAQILVDETPVGQQTIAMQRQRVLDAILSGDYAIWGL